MSRTDYHEPYEVLCEKYGQEEKFFRYRHYVKNHATFIFTYAEHELYLKTLEELKGIKELSVRGYTKDGYLVTDKNFYYPYYFVGNSAGRAILLSSKNVFSQELKSELVSSGAQQREEVLSVLRNISGSGIKVSKNFQNFYLIDVDFYSDGLKLKNGDGGDVVEDSTYSSFYPQKYRVSKRVRAEEKYGNKVERHNAKKMASQAVKTFNNSSKVVL